MGKPQRFRAKSDGIEAIQFTTNNEDGSPSMDGIVNWVNRGRTTMAAWHNGTDIYVVISPSAEDRAKVGDWIVRTSQGNFAIVTNPDFIKTYEPYEPVA